MPRRSSKPTLSARRVLTLVESDAHGKAGGGRLRASALGQSTFIGRHSKSCRDAPSRQRLHHPLREQAVSDCTRVSVPSCVAPGTGGEAPRRYAGSALPRSVFDRQRMRSSAESRSGASTASQPRKIVRCKSDWMKNFHLGKNDPRRKTSVR